MELNSIQKKIREKLQWLKTQAKPLQQQIMASPTWQQTVQRWQQLSMRERYLVMGTGALLGIVVFYKLIYLPIATSITRYQQDVVTDQELLMFVQSASPRILAASGKGRPQETLSSDMLLPTIENTLKEDGMADVVSSLSLTGDNKVSLQFEAVEFDGLLGWLVQIRQRYGIQVETLSAKPVDLPGFASVTLQLVLIN